MYSERSQARSLRDHLATLPHEERSEHLQSQREHSGANPYNEESRYSQTQRIREHPEGSLYSKRSQARSLRDQLATNLYNEERQYSQTRGIREFPNVSLYQERSHLSQTQGLRDHADAPLYNERNHYSQTIRTFSTASMHSEGSQHTQTRTPSISEQITQAEADLAARQSHLQILKRKEEYKKKLAWQAKEMRKFDRTLVEEMYNTHNRETIDSRAKVRLLRHAAADSPPSMAKPTALIQDSSFQNLPPAITSGYPLNTDRSRYHSAPATHTVPQSQDACEHERDAYLATTMANIMDRSRLPVPTPKPFTGNPTDYTSFKRSFKALIEKKAITAEEKIYYLQYLHGDAKEAVAGCFYGREDSDYQRAWQTLERRFGHPFRIQEAFQEKLNNWPKLSNKDNTGLQQYADFLRSCQDAMPHIQGLRVLNDCKENQKLASKLPDHLIQRWSRTATDYVDNLDEYPDFSHFVAFVEKGDKGCMQPNSPTWGFSLVETHTGMIFVVFDDPLQVLRDTPVS